MSNNNFSGVLQENILTLLCFDKQAAPIIKNAVDPGLFSSQVFKDVAYEASEFHDLFNEPIGNHLPDVFEEKLNASDARVSNIYRQVIYNLHDTKDSINKNYVMTSLRAFIRDRRMSVGITDAAKLVKSGKVEEAEGVLLKALKSQELNAFDHGMFLNESPYKILDHLRAENPFISTGIPYFDKVSVGAAPGELLTIMAPPGRGKTWSMIHLGKMALLQRKNVLHITLEMSEPKIMTRYYQSILSIARRKARNKSPDILINKDGRFDGLEFTTVKRPTLKSKNLSKLIQSRTPNVMNRYRLLVKQFPTGSLTIKQLESYLDLVERQHKFIPDVLIVDYADLMQIDSSQLRINTGISFRNLRGIMMERNLAGITASQSNKLSEDAKWITLKHMAEDYSKAATSDIVLSVCQTYMEKENNLARLFVCKNRDEEDGGTVLVSQGLSYGQFVTGSVQLNSDDGDHYWKEVGDNPSMIDTGGGQE